MLLNELAPVLSVAARAAASPAVRSIVADAASKKFKQTMASKYAPKPANAGTRPPTTVHNYVGPSQGQSKKQEKQDQASNSNNSRRHPRTVTNITNNHYNNAANSNNQEPELTPGQKAAKEAEEKKKNWVVNKTISSIPSATGKFAKWLSDSVQMQASTP